MFRVSGSGFGVLRGLKGLYRVYGKLYAFRV